MQLSGCLCRSHGITTRLENWVHHWLGIGNSAYLQGIVYGSYRIERVEGTTSRVAWSGFYLPKCITVWSADVVREKEGRVYVTMHRLPWAKQGDHKKQVSLATDRWLVRSTQGSFGILKDWSSFGISSTQGARRRRSEDSDPNTVWPLWILS